MSLISVIIPSYNCEEKLIFRCIKSILSQSLQDFEIIIVDDGSNDEYGEILNRAAAFDKNKITLLRKENGGVSSARNYGLKYASGSYVVYVDADDILLPHFFEEAYHIAQKEQADIVYGCNMLIKDYQTNQAFCKLIEGDVRVLTDEEFSELKPYMVGTRMQFQNGLLYIGHGPWTRLVKMEIARTVPFPSCIAICEDITWNLQLLRKCRKVCIVQRAWYLYNSGNFSSATRRYNQNIIYESRAGLDAVAKNLDMQVDREYRAFADKCFEEVDRIYYGYVGHRKFHEGKNVKKSIYNMLYTEKPWNVLMEKRLYQLSLPKDKLKILLYRWHMYYLYLRCKKKLL